MELGELTCQIRERETWVLVLERRKTLWDVLRASVMRLGSGRTVLCVCAQW